jgi:hypothetical protein
MTQEGFFPMEFHDREGPEKSYADIGFLSFRGVAGSPADIDISVPAHEPFGFDRLGYAAFQYSASPRIGIGLGWKDKGEASVAYPLSDIVSYRAV